MLFAFAGVIVEGPRGSALTVGTRTVTDGGTLKFVLRSMQPAGREVA
jgi:hypothetical protein